MRSIPSKTSFILDTIGGNHEDLEDEDEALALEIMKGGVPAPPDGKFESN